jgi:hypothetical protein
MKVRRTTATATLLTALATGSVLLTSAGTASAQDPAHHAPRPVPGMARMDELMLAGNPGMARMDELMLAGNPGMARMHQLMLDGPR